MFKHSEVTYTIDWVELYGGLKGYKTKGNTI